jgi:hypothetical protein
MKQVASAPVLICMLLTGSWSGDGAQASPTGQYRPEAATRVSEKEHLRTIKAMRPPKRARPVVAVLADNDGAETTDFLVPYGILARSGAADVFAVTPRQAPVRLRPALQVQADLSLEGTSERFPDGADYVPCATARRTIGRNSY